LNSWQGVVGKDPFILGGKNIYLKAALMVEMVAGVAISFLKQMPIYIHFKMCDIEGSIKLMTVTTEVVVEKLGKMERILLFWSQLVQW
jgi:hypothetical protein